MASSSSSSSSVMSCFVLLILFSFCHQFLSSESKSLILPLQIQKIPSMSLPRQQPNRLRFHHNVTLTVTLAVGSPPQNVTMVLDTGSELSWLLCSNSSRSSPVTAPYFHLPSSASYSPVPCSSPTCRSKTRDLPIPAACEPSSRLCHVSLSYADASSSDGVLAADSFVVGNSPPVRTVFGCMDPAASYCHRERERKRKREGYYGLHMSYYIGFCVLGAQNFLCLLLGVFGGLKKSWVGVA